MWGFIKNLGTKIFDGIKTIGGTVLKPIKYVKDIGKDVYNMIEDIPVVGQATQFVSDMLPGVVKKGIGVADNFVDLSNEAMQGNLRGVLKEGKELIKAGLGSRSKG